MLHILLIDDDERLAELLQRYFERFEIELTAATEPEPGLRLLREERFDLVILDVMLPQMDGFEVCREIRKQSEIPILMLTARGEVMDRVVGLELGADDYMPKPFEPRELVARIHTILKRSGRQTAQQHLQFGGLSLDTLGKEAQLEGAPLPLSTMEYRLLEIFARHPGETLSRDTLLNLLRGTETEIYTRSVDILVSRLRQKLKPHDVIKTVRGEGYCFTARSSA